MPFFSDLAVEAGDRDTSAVKQRLSAYSGQSLSAVLSSGLMTRYVSWMCPCGKARLVAMLPDGLEEAASGKHCGCPLGCKSGFPVGAHGTWPGPLLPWDWGMPGLRAGS